MDDKPKDAPNSGRATDDGFCVVISKEVAQALAQAYIDDWRARAIAEKARAGMEHSSPSDEPEREL
jgi:hypothetical protein